MTANLLPVDDNLKTSVFKDEYGRATAAEIDLASGGIKVTIAGIVGGGGLTGGMAAEDAGPAWTVSSMSDTVSSFSDPVAITGLPETGKVLVLDDAVLWADGNCQIGLYNFVDDGNGGWISQFLASLPLTADVPIHLCLRDGLWSWLPDSGIYIMLTGSPSNFGFTTAWHSADNIAPWENFTGAPSVSLPH